MLLKTQTICLLIWKVIKKNGHQVCLVHLHGYIKGALISVLSSPVLRWPLYENGLWALAHAGFFFFCALPDGTPLSELSWPSSLAVVAVSFSGLFTFVFLMLACLCCKKGDIGFKVSSMPPPAGGRVEPHAVQQADAELGFQIPSSTTKTKLTRAPAN